MNVCLQITFSYVKMPKNYLQTTILKNARNLQLEGTVQADENNIVRIIACGSKGLIDEFVDIIHNEASTREIEHIEIEPFLKKKDYRGIFRYLQ